MPSLLILSCGFRLQAEERATGGRMTDLVVFHLDQCSHPRVNAALKAMVAWRQSVYDVRAASGNVHDTRSDALRGRRQRGDSRLAQVQGGNASPAEVGHLGERMDPSSVIADLQTFPGLGLQVGGIEPPCGVPDHQRRQWGQAEAVELRQGDVSFRETAAARRRPARVRGIAVIAKRDMAVSGPVAATCHPLIIAAFTIASPTHANNTTKIPVRRISHLLPRPERGGPAPRRAPSVWTSGAPSAKAARVPANPVPGLGPGKSSTKVMIRGICVTAPVTAYEARNDRSAIVGAASYPAGPIEFRCRIGALRWSALSGRLPRLSPVFSAT